MKCADGNMEITNVELHDVPTLVPLPPLLRVLPRWGILRKNTSPGRRVSRVNQAASRRALAIRTAQWKGSDETPD